MYVSFVCMLCDDDTESEGMYDSSDGSNEERNEGML